MGGSTERDVLEVSLAHSALKLRTLYHKYCLEIRMALKNKLDLGEDGNNLAAPLFSIELDIEKVERVTRRPAESVHAQIDDIEKLATLFRNLLDQRQKLGEQNQKSILARELENCVCILDQWAEAIQGVFQLRCDTLYLSSSGKWTPLLLACANDQLSTVHTLVQHGGDVNAQDFRGWTPLFWAAFIGNIEMVLFLLANGAKHFARSRSGWTPLHWAVLQGHGNIVVGLLKHHTQYLLQKTSKPKPPLRTMSFQQALDLKAVLTLTPAEIAADLDDPVIFDILASQISDVASVYKDETFNGIWAQDKFDAVSTNTLLSFTRRDMLSGPEHRVPDLSDGDLKRAAFEGNSRRSRLLHASIRDARFSAMKILIDVGADVNYNPSVSPLHIAAFRKDSRYVSLLLAKGADPNVYDTKGLTPLHQAVINGFADDIIALLNAGADPNARCLNAVVATLSSDDKRRLDSVTPLILACGLGFGFGHLYRPPRYDSYISDSGKLASEIIRLLIARGADPLLQDDKGMTALHYACMRPTLGMIEPLIEGGAKVTILNHADETPLHILGKEKLQGSGADDMDKILGLLLQGYNETTRASLLSAEAHVALSTRPIIRTASDMSTPLEEAKTEAAKRKSDQVQKCEKLKSNIRSASPVTLALYHGKWRTFCSLVECGAPVPEDVPIQQIIYGPIQELSVKTVRVLTEHLEQFEGSENSVITLVDGLVIALEQRPTEVDDSIESFKSILEILRFLGADVNKVDENSTNSAIIVAAGRIESQNGRVIEALIEAGCDPYYKNGSGIDSFLMAALNLNMANLRYLIGYAFRVPNSNHWTKHLRTVWTADSDDLLAICKALRLDGSIDYRRINPSGQALIHRAASLGNYTMIIYLIAEGAALNVTAFNRKSSRNCLPVHFAALNGHTDAVRCLFPIIRPLPSIESQAMFPDYRNLGGTSIVDVFEEQGIEQNNMLHCSIRFNDISLFRHLLEQGADVDFKGLFNGQGQHGLWRNSPLYLAAESGNNEMVSDLISYGAATEGFNKSNGMIGSYQSSGWEPLHIAVWRQHFDVVRTLVNSGVDVQRPVAFWSQEKGKPVGMSIRDSWNGQALHLAVMVANYDIVEFLLDHGADIHAEAESISSAPPQHRTVLTNRTAAHGPRVLHIALDGSKGYNQPHHDLTSERLRVAQLLVDRGANIEGVANHLTIQDVWNFEGFEDLWDVLREGIWKGGQSV